MRKSVKRVIAGVLSAVLSLSLVNFSALSMSLASELSGYGITVEYSEDNTSATLVGDTSGVKEGVQLDKLVDSEGQELDPNTFYQTVEENGTYHFTLYYQETVETQDADQPTTEEKTQELEVVVNGIGTPKADQPAPTATPEVQEGVVMGSEDEKDAPSPFVQKVESMTAAPRTVPLDVLQRNMAQARASKTVHIYADEAEYKLQEVAFSGGSLVAGAAGLPTVSGRTFVKADYIIDGSTISRTINGLYFYNNQWYYTVGENSVNGGDAGTVYLGFELPADATVRLYYKVTNTQKYQLDASGSGADLASEYKMYLNGQQNYSWLMYPQGTKIVLNFVMPLTLSGLTINISNVGNYNITSAKELGNNTLTEKQIWETSTQNYTLVFTMPAKAVKITFNGTQWTNSDIRQFAIGSDFQPERGESFNNTQMGDYNNTWGSFFRSIPYDQYNSPGIVNNASVTHVDGGMEYSPRTSFQVYNQGSSAGTRTMLFAGGSYRSGQMVGFELRMDRRTSSYAWKANSLVLNAYIGEQYTGSNKNFRQYTIQLAHTDSLTTGSTKDTYLDCGAWVRTQCRQWTEDVYYYRIFVYDMTHNFTLYDRPAKTNKTNFVITQMNGFEVAKPGKYNVGDLSVSFAADYNIYDAAAYPIHINDDWTIDWLGKQAVNLRQKQLYLRPKYGYTAPQGNIPNPRTGTSLTPLGQVLQSQGGQSFYVKGLYHFALQSDTNYQQGKGGTPVELAFNSKPMQIQVKYRADGKDYFDPKVTLMASGNSAYTLQEKLPSNAGGKKLKGYEIKMSVRFYKNTDTSGKVYTEDVKISSRDDNTNGYWYPNQILTFADIYDALQGMGKVTIDEISTLRINPVYVSAGETPVQAKLEVKEQTKFADLDNNTANNRNLTTEGQNANATSTKKDVNAYLGSTVSMYGNKEHYTKNGKQYLYNETASRPVGTVTAENPIVTSLEYVLATAATVNTGTLGTNHNYNSWKSNIEGKWFTSIGNFNHIINISALNPGTKDGMIFDGWQIRAGGSTFKVNENTMVWNDNGTKYLSLAKIGRQESDLWTKIFNNGTFALEATWKSNVEPIKNAQGNTSLVTNTPAYVVDGDTAGFEISAVFKYGTKTVVSGTAGNNQVTLSEIQQKIANNSIKLVVLKKNANAGTTDPWRLWFSENGARPNADDASRPFPISLKGTSVDTQSGGFKVTFEVKKNSAVSPPYEDGAVYRIFAWSEANDTNGNQGLKTLTGNQLLAAMNGNTSAILNLIPCVKTDVKVLKKVTLKDGGLTNQDGGVVYFVDNQSGALSITGEFKYGDGTAALSDIQQMFDAGALKIALIKKNPSSEGGDWQARFGPNTPISGVFAGPTITKDNGSQTFKVTFTVNGPIGAQWNDGANFRIFAWTAANDGTANLTETQIVEALKTNDNPYNGQIPSVNVPVTMLYKVKSADGSITNKPGTNVEIKQGDNSFTFSGTFQYGKTTATLEEIKALYNDGNGKLKIALIKKDPGGDTWQTRVFGSSIRDGFSGPTITGNGNAFKVEFTVSGSPIDPVWNDGANFRIFVWTAANDGGQDLTANAICTALNGAEAGANPYDTKIPSVNVQATVVFQVKSSGGASIVDTPADLEINEGASSFTLTGTFQYGDTTADQAKLRALLASGNLKIGLLKKDPGATQWQIRYGDGTASFGQPTITKAEGSSDFTVSFTVNNTAAQYTDGASFRILAWTNANATNEDGSALTVTNIMNALNDAAEGENPYDGKIPSATINATMLYKVKSSDGSITNKGTTVQIYEGGNSFKVSGTFQYGKTTASLEDIKALYNDGNGKLKIALLKQNPGGGNWEQRAFGSSVSGGFSGPVITGTGNAFKVEFTVSGTPIDPAWNNGANFRIFVWTAANDGGQDLTATTICTELNGANGGNPYDGKIPSVNVQAAMMFKVYSSGGTSITNADKNLEIREGAASFELTGTFQYGNTTVDQTGLQNLFNGGTLKIGLLKMGSTTGENGQRTWEVVQYSGDTAITGQPTITKAGDSNEFTVTFTVNKEITGPSVDGASFRILVWTDANAKKDADNSLTIADIKDALNGAGDTNPYDGKIPSVTTNITMLYKVTSAGTDGTITNQNGTAVVIQGGQASFEISAEFQYGDGSASAEKIQQLYNDSKLKIALLKKDPQGTEWTVRVFDTAQDGFSMPVITQEGTSFKATFTVNKNITAPLNDGANFRVFAWTAANQDAASLTADAIASALNSAGETNPYDGKVPSVNVQTTMMFKVTTAGGTTITNTDKNLEIYDGTTSFTLSGTFRYGDTTADQTKLRELFANGTLKIGLLKKDPGTQDWQLRYGDGAENFGQPTITKDAGATDFTVSFTVNKGITGPSIDGASLRILVWTDANATNDGGSSLTITNIKDALNGADEGTNPYDGKIPSVTTNTTLLYKVTSSDGTLINEETTVEIYEGGKSFKVSGTFQYGKTDVTLEELEALYKNGADDGKLKIALIKKDPGATNWQKRVFGTSIWNGFSGPVLTKEGDTFKVEFTVSGNPIDPQWNDGANFRILVWTAANDGGEGLTADDICTALNNANGGNPYNGKIPSVNVQSTMSYKVTTGGGTTIVDTPVALEINEGATSFTLTGTFRYGDATADQAKLLELFNSGNGKLKIGLLKKDPGTENWQLRYGDETASFGEPTITKADGASDFTVTFTVSKGITGSSIDGASLRMLVWTDANATNTDGNSLTITSIMNTLNTEGEDAYNGKIPSVTTNTTLLYKVKSSDGSIENKPEADVVIYGGAESFTISGSFQYGDGNATQEKIQQLYDNGKLKIALLKKDPQGTEWAVRVFETAQDGFSKPVITQEGTSFTATFTVSKNIVPEWNDGANFRVFAWTAANEGTANLTAETIANALTAAGATNPYDGKIPSVNVQTIMLFKVTHEDGSVGSTGEQAVEVNVGGALGLEASFLYGDSTADQQKLRDLFAAGKLHIALIKMDPEIWTQKWTVVSGAAATPTITKEADAGTFKVSFQVSSQVEPQYDDGSQFRIYVWTDANGIRTDGSSITADNITNVLNNPDGENQPDIGVIPLEHYNVSILYKVVNKDDDTSKTVNVLATAANIPLTGTFKYNYDGTRYYQGFTEKMLKELIAAEKFNVTIEVTRKDGKSQTIELASEEVKTCLSADTQGNGIINFTYNFVDGTSADLSAYDGATFKVKVYTVANGTDATAYPFYTITVTYISDPTAYVDIPKYIILDDNSSNVVSGGKKQDGYAGKKVDVKYNADTMAGTFKPSIEVKVEDGVLLKEGSVGGKPMADMPIGIYDTSGAKIAQDQANTGYCSVGTLTSDTPEGTISFWMNTKRGTVKNQQYYATVMFMLEMAGTMT